MTDFEEEVKKIDEKGVDLVIDFGELHVFRGRENSC